VASISTSSGGSVRIFFYDRLKKRRVIHLGRVPNSDAEAICRRIERFLNSQILGNEPTRADFEWLAKSGLAKKFASAGIIEPQDHIEHSERMTVAEFLQSYMDRRGPTVKPATRVVWTQVIENLKSFLPEGIYLDELTVGHAKDVYTKLRAKMRPSTVSKRIGFCRQFFNDAVDWKKMKANPFSSVKAPRPKAKVNEFVPRDEINRVMAKANTRWKVIIALARYGGLRTPSETLSLKWSHVDWENNRMHIPEPKVEHHDGRGVRQCPLFPELRLILEEAWDLYGDSSEYVVDAAAYRAAAMKESGWQNANLRTQLLKLLEKAGVDPWPRLFHSMRASRQTELEREFPTYVVCAWLGNSEKIAKESYLLVTEDHFATATAKRVINPTQFVAERVINPTPQGPRIEHANQHFAEGNIDETVGFPRLIITVEMENRGLEENENSPANTEVLKTLVINPTQDALSQIEALFESLTNDHVESM
jgi:integrase